MFLTFEKEKFTYRITGSFIMFWLGVVIGLFAGTIAGMAIMALCQTAAKNEEEQETLCASQPKTTVQELKKPPEKAA